MFFLAGNMLYVRRMYVFVHKRLEEECGIIKESGSCTLRPPRLFLCCFPLHRRQTSSDITSSALSSTATKPTSTKGLAWRLNNSACNPANRMTAPDILILLKIRRRLWVCCDADSYDRAFFGVCSAREYKLRLFDVRIRVQTGMMFPTNSSV